MSRGNKAGNSHRTPGTCAANKKARVKFIFIFPFSSHHVIHSLPADPTLHISNSKSRLKILPHSSTLTLSFRNIHPDGLACSKGDGPAGQFKLSEPCKWLGLMQIISVRWKSVQTSRLDSYKEDDPVHQVQFAKDPGHLRGPASCKTYIRLL